MGVTKVVESAVIDATLGDVWAAVRSEGLKFYPGVSGPAKDLVVGEEFTLKFSDGTVQTNKCLEVSELSRTVTWEVSFYVFFCFDKFVNIIVYRYSYCYCY